MNIFALSKKARKAARCHCDQHAGKMLVETAQMLYTHLASVGVQLPPGPGRPYKPAYQNHPCTLWLHGGRAHFFWLLELGLWLAHTFTKRYGKGHKTEAHLRHMAKHVHPKALQATCKSKAWLRRLTKRGLKAKVLSACAAKVATVNAPEGCRFGVVCMGEDPNLLARTSRGHINLTASYKNFYAEKNAHQFPMVWNKLRVPPPELSDTLV